jgi:hypothetical protein
LLYKSLSNTIFFYIDQIVLYLHYFLKISPFHWSFHLFYLPEATEPSIQLHQPSPPATSCPPGTSLPLWHSIHCTLELVFSLYCMKQLRLRSYPRLNACLVNKFIIVRCHQVIVFDKLQQCLISKTEDVWGYLSRHCGFNRTNWIDISPVKPTSINAIKRSWLEYIIHTTLARDEMK